jgi:hypothetical protein
VLLCIGFETAYFRFDTLDAWCFAHTMFFTHLSCLSALMQKAANFKSFQVSAIRQFIGEVVNLHGVKRMRQVDLSVILK